MGKDILNFLPISVNISGKKILIIGGGKVGHHKASILSRFTDSGTVISPDFHEGFKSLPFNLVQRKYQKSDLNGAFLVYICTENMNLNAQIKKDAESLGVLASVCDAPDICDFISPAIYKDGNVTVAVSSDARDVRQSIAIRNRIAELAKDGTLPIDAHRTHSV